MSAELGVEAVHSLSRRVLPRNSLGHVRDKGPGVIDISDRWSLEVIEHPSNAGIFEIARRFRGGATIAELVSCSGLSEASVSASATVLVAAGLLRQVRARASRPVRFAATCEVVFIVANDDDEHQLKALRRHLERSSMDLGVALDAEERLGAGPLPGKHRLDARMKFSLRADEWVEFESLCQEVVGFLERAAASRGKGTPRELMKCDHVLSLRLRPCPTPLLPSPIVRFVNPAYMRGPGRRHGLGMLDRLTDREREVSMMVVANHRRAEIAKRLGVSVNTVATLLRRAYAKLGVHNRQSLRILLTRMPGEGPGRHGRGG